MKRFLLFLIFLFSGFALCSGCAASNKTGTIDDRISSLEQASARQNKKNIVQDRIINKLRKGNDLAQKNYASIKAELKKFRITILKLKGIIEETGHKFSSLDGAKASDTQDKHIQALNNKILDISRRIEDLERYIGLEASGKQAGQPEIKSSDNDTSTIKSKIATDEEAKKNPEALYKHAKSLLDNGKYDAARLEFEKFINFFPDSKNADNARFWIADSYYREKWYNKAILEYQKVIEKYSTGNKVPAALLKQGFAFAELGEKANARLILKELIKKYPDSKEASFAEKKLMGLKK